MDAAPCLVAKMGITLRREIIQDSSLYLPITGMTAGGNPSQNSDPTGAFNSALGIQNVFHFMGSSASLCAFASPPDVHSGVRARSSFPDQCARETPQIAFKANSVAEWRSGRDISGSTRKNYMRSSRVKAAPVDGRRNALELRSAAFRAGGDALRP
jgi:hypothetical protein